MYLNLIQKQTGKTYRERIKIPKGQKGKKTEVTYKPEPGDQKSNFIQPD